MKRSEMIEKLTEHLILCKIYSDFNDPDSFKKNAEIVLKWLEEHMRPCRRGEHGNPLFYWEPEND